MAVLGHHTGVTVQSSTGNENLHIGDRFQDKITYLMPCVQSYSNYKNNICSVYMQLTAKAH